MVVSSPAELVAMYDGHLIGVVVPAYNEEGLIGEVIRTIPAYVDRVYAVDDASTDGTRAEIQRAAEDVNRTLDAETERWSRTVVPLSHETNRGVGGAIKTGYRQAVADGIDVVSVMGGDGQMPPEELMKILRPITDGRAGYAKGNRLIDLKPRDEMPLFRYVGNNILSQLTKIASGYWGVSDPQNGFTAISREALKRLDLDELHEDYGYCNELLVRLNVANVRVAEVPHPPVYGDEESHIKYSTYIPRVSMLLFRSFCWRLRRLSGPGIHPVTLGYSVAAVLFTWWITTVVRSLGIDRRGLESATATVRPLVVFIAGLIAVILDRDGSRSLSTVVPEQTEWTADRPSEDETPPS